MFRKKAKSNNNNIAHDNSVHTRRVVFESETDGPQTIHGHRFNDARNKFLLILGSKAARLIVASHYPRASEREEHDKRTC